MAEGIKQHWEGVYLTDSAESAAKWVGLKLHALGEDSVVVFEVEVEAHKLSDGTDHSPIIHELMGVGESILHEGNISNKKIKNVLEFSFKDKSNA